MIYPVVGVSDESSGDFDTYYPWIYTSSGWKRCRPAVYNGGWHYMGETLWLQWRDKDGKDMTDSNGNPIQVRMKEANQGRDTHDMTRSEILETFYPIGAIYMSLNNTNPSQLFGGTWTQIKDKFILAAGSTYGGNTTGGSATHTHTLSHTYTTPATNTGSTTLTVNQIPAHNHYFANNSKVAAGSDRDTGLGMPGSWYGSGGYQLWWIGQTVKNTGGGQGHTHSQVATTTNSQSTSTTSSSSNLPPYLAVYVWQRTA